MSGISLDEMDDIVAVSATDLDIRDLDHTTDDVSLGDGTNLLLFKLIDSAFEATAVTMPISGIRQDGSGSPVSATGDAHPLVFNNDGELKVAADLTSDTADDAVDSGNPVKIGGRGESGVLTALSASGDRYDLLGDLYRRTYINDSANIGIKSTAVTVGTTVGEVVGTPLAGRRFVTIQNESANNEVYVGAAAITTATGVKISKRASATFQWGEDINIFMISDAAGNDVRILESA